MYELNACGGVYRSAERWRSQIFGSNGDVVIGDSFSVQLYISPHS